MAGSSFFGSPVPEVIQVVFSWMEGELNQRQLDKGLQQLMQRNVETISKLEQATESQRTPGDTFADAVAKFCGTMSFVYIHVAFFGLWLLWNSPWITPKTVRFDPPPFQTLSTIVSLEAIFLSSFILISQNRQQRLADRRNHLDLQINLLAEQENSQMLTMLQQLIVAQGLGSPSAEAQILQQATDPEVLVDQIEQVIEAEPREDSD